VSRSPTIGISMYGPDEDRIAPAITLPLAYAESVARAGGVPLLLPPITPIPDALLDRIDGVILAGGGDIDPGLHGSQTHEAVYMVNPQRDQFEIELIRRVLAHPTRPVFGICRGMQMLNVALGGSLDLHLPDVHGEAVLHRRPPRVPVEHEVELGPDTLLSDLLPERRFPVCSWHHQSVRTVGRELVVAGHAPDGVIEALVHTQHPFAFGVQWHPELQPDDPLQQRLFEALVEQARRGMRER